MTREFQPLYCADQIQRINRHGTVGLVTLWSRLDYVLQRLGAAGVDLAPETSPIAAVGTLYGNGLRELLRNLLYNPQIDSLVLLGRNRSGSQEELLAFFADGLEPHPGEALSYEPGPNGERPRAMRIRGTRRVIDSLVTPQLFQRPPRLKVLGSARDDGAIAQAAAFLAAYRPRSGPLPARLAVELPRVRIDWFPSEPGGHSIVATDPLGAWKQVIHRLVRFARPVNLVKGPRRELQNLKVLVTNPGTTAIDEAELRRLGFDPDRLRRYRQDILDGALQADETYTYGNRLRAHFGLDSLAAAAERLRRDPEDRKSYVVLWDPRRDLTAEHGHPCLVSVFFRRFANRLTLSAGFRTHNAMDAWLVNFFGLRAVQRWVAERSGLEPGAITVISHSITLDGGQLDRAQLIAREAAADRGYREDPMGYFKITLDRDAILVEHRHGDITLAEYRHRKAARLQQMIYRDGALSDINHAIYLGRQLARAEQCLADGGPFVQE